MYVMYDSIILGIKLIKSELRLNGIVRIILDDDDDDDDDDELFLWYG